VLIAISITDVGVAVFSDIRNNSVRKAKEQISSPEPAMLENKPPRKPVAINTHAFQLMDIKPKSNKIPSCFYVYILHA
jgi:hypothetical protein